MLSVKDLSFKYSTSHEKALCNISFTVDDGDMLLVCGETGSGKSTLLRLLKREISPRGEFSGEIMLDGRPISELSDCECAARIGYVSQYPEEQIVTDRVWHELAFGLESLGLPSDTIRRRVAETASFFGIEAWFEKSTAELSGGQKQLLALASVMVMQPDILLLDEPTARLDPIAAAELISAVARLNRELSLTVIIAEHRLDEALPHSKHFAFLKKGSMLLFDRTADAVKAVTRDRARFTSACGALPGAARLYASLSDILPEAIAPPLTIGEGRAMVKKYFNNSIRSLSEAAEPNGKKDKLSHFKQKYAVEFRDVRFKYERSGEDVLRGLSLQVKQGEIFCLLGGNGSGKSTALSVAAGLLHPYCGSVRIFEKKLTAYSSRELYQNNIGMLPQDVRTVFRCNSVREELSEANAELSALPFDTTLELLDMHPYDLSGGQQELLALSKLLARDPRILLLDEPTKGLDAATRAAFKALLLRLRDEGRTMILVTHDADFAAECADRCALLFRGEVVCSDTPREFFNNNFHYTTAANRICRGSFDRIVGIDEAADICRLNGLRANEARMKERSCQ